ncbi:transcriptional regulator with XRE-family HTH domain [Acholeplasma morum]|jgi:transcriptional regulator with XRE-family HTH domain|uniref:cupin domain-containing protein n=1 Tax=Paracholeplasma morum TaxID=264637 RepID=UPI001F39CB90|nr:cupin domain-containing protein [Paracholeplasma morum]MBM7453407.1 transcriptional regulator with XRE-family HTH domain [Paracholeplasma morum]
MDIGSKIRELRLENGLTQEELANRLELTKGYISQLEHNLASPSMNTLFSILEVLGTDVSDFFSNQIEEQVVFKKSDFYEKENGDLKHNVSWIVPNALKYEMEPIIIEIQPGGKSFEDDPHAGEEFGYVLEGEVTLVINKKKYIVKTGETFYYLANKEHHLTNHTNKKAKVLWISTPPMF